MGAGAAASGREKAGIAPELRANCARRTGVFEERDPLQHLRVEVARHHLRQRPEQRLEVGGRHLDAAHRADGDDVGVARRVAALEARFAEEGLVGGGRDPHQFLLAARTMADDLARRDHVERVGGVAHLDDVLAVRKVERLGGVGDLGALLGLEPLERKGVASE